jgi:hypothetical protein
VLRSSNAALILSAALHGRGQRARRLVERNGGFSNERADSGCERGIAGQHQVKDWLPFSRPRAVLAAA